MITALVLMNVEPGRIEALAEDLLTIDGVTEVYSVAAPYDLVAIARVREHDALSDLVTELIGSRPGIISTETLIALRAFAKRDLGLVWDLGIESELKQRELLVFLEVFGVDAHAAQAPHEIAPAVVEQHFLRLREFDIA